MTWKPKTPTMKTENVALYHAQIFNQLNRNRSILFTQGGRNEN